MTEYVYLCVIRKMVWYEVHIHVRRPYNKLHIQLHISNYIYIHIHTYNIYAYIYTLIILSMRIHVQEMKKRFEEEKTALEHELVKLHDSVRAERAKRIDTETSEVSVSTYVRMCIHTYRYYKHACLSGIRKNSYMHTYILTYMDTHIHGIRKVFSYIRTYTNACVHAYICTFTCMDVYTTCIHKFS